MSISKKVWTFPARPYYYILLFPKINREPNNSKTEGRKGHTGPPGQPRGEGLPAGSSLVPAAPNTDGLSKGQKWYGPRSRSILRRGGKNTQKNCTKKIFTTQIITMV